MSLGHGPYVVTPRASLSSLVSEESGRSCSLITCWFEDSFYLPCPTPLSPASISVRRGHYLFVIDVDMKRDSKLRGIVRISHSSVHFQCLFEQIVANLIPTGNPAHNVHILNFIFNKDTLFQKAPSNVFFS